MERRMELESLKGHDHYPFQKNVTRFGQSIMSRQEEFLNKYSMAFKLGKLMRERETDLNTDGYQQNWNQIVSVSVIILIKSLPPTQMEFRWLSMSFKSHNFVLDAPLHRYIRLGRLVGPWIDSLVVWQVGRSMGWFVGSPTCWSVIGLIDLWSDRSGGQ